MTQRERHTAEGGAAQAPPPAGRAASPAPAACPASAWEEWYARASPERRHELLSLAARQGIVHAHQLGPAPNGDPGSTSRTLLPSLLAGRVRELEPLYPLEIDFRGSELDPAQRDAVARALATPDVCLIQGAPGTGKSRVVAEILARAAERGERALLLAPSAPALDRALELLGPRESVCAIRCTTSEELPESTPACVGRLTLAERVRAFEQQTLPRRPRSRPGRRTLPGPGPRGTAPVGPVRGRRPPLRADGRTRAGTPERTRRRGGSSGRGGRHARRRTRRGCAAGALGRSRACAGRGAGAARLATGRRARRGGKGARREGRGGGRARAGDAASGSPPAQPVLLRRVLEGPLPGRHPGPVRRVEAARGGADGGRTTPGDAGRGAGGPARAGRAAV